MPNGKVIGREHNHDVEPEKIGARKRRQAFKIQVEEQPHANIGVLVASARDRKTVVRNAMPCIDQMERKEFRPAPRIESLEDIDMTLERSKMAIRGPAGDLEVNFLLHDSGGNDPNRLLIFGTTNSVASLGQSRKIHADGTFKITLMPFKQVYVLHFEESDKLFPGAFVLLSGKTKLIYGHMFQVMQTFCQYEATKVITDFEFQAMQSFGDTLSADVEGCFFHFAQAIMKAAHRFDTFSQVRSVTAEEATLRDAARTCVSAACRHPIRIRRFGADDEVTRTARRLRATTRLHGEDLGCANVQPYSPRTGQIPSSHLERAHAHAGG